MHSPRRGHQVVRGPRRATEWISSADATGLTSLAASGTVLDQSLTSANLASITPFTVVRTRGSLWVRSDQVAGTEEPFGALGFQIVNDNAATAGVASLDTPITNEGSDGFFVHQFWQAGFIFADATGFAAPGWSRYDFDSKAMRKVESQDAIVVTLENASAGAGAAYILKFRMLAKLN